MLGRDVLRYPRARETEIDNCFSAFRICGNDLCVRS